MIKGLGERESGTVPNPQSGLGFGNTGQPGILKAGIERATKIWRGVDEGAIQIEQVRIVRFHSAMRRQFHLA
jgi:hypothetical protein